MLKLKGFTRTFWIANFIELFERFAYYGSKAILAVFVADQVGLGPEKAGWLVGSLFNGLLYFLPILAGTVVDRYGFKKSLGPERVSPRERLALECDIRLPGPACSIAGSSKTGCCSRNIFSPPPKLFTGGCGGWTGSPPRHL